MSTTATALDPTSTEYVSLAFGIERLVPGFVDAYFGPPEVKTSAAEGDAPDPVILRDQIQELLIRISGSDLDPSRIGYLTSQLGAMLAICRRLAGEEMAYTDEVRHLFDVDAIRTPDDVFASALAELDAALPGSGPVAARMTAWREQFHISPGVAGRLIDIILPEIRRRTLKIVDLPPGEEIEFRFVQNEPWSGYNWYLGNARSRVDLNTDLPIEANQLTNLLCHEAYPGHHAEHTLKELLYRKRGYGEHAIQLINTPECIISEGIATLAEEMAFGEDEIIPFRHEVVYPAAGISVDAGVERAVRSASHALRAVPGNAALMLHADGRTEAEAVEYLMTYGLQPEANARKRLEFIANPLWRAYIFTYHAGYDLLRHLLDARLVSQRTEQFRVMLTDQVFPSLITRWLAEAST